MFRSVKTSWKRLAAGRPGSRFQDLQRRHRRGRRGPWVRIGTLAAGLVIMAAGVVALPAPGPGMLIIALGGALAARESAAVARVLDWIELRGRWLVSLGLAVWRRAPVFGKAVGALAGIGLMAMVAGVAYVILTG
jgi:hypothetical protein